MDYASLVFGLWVGCSYCLLDPCKSVCTDDKYVLYPSVLQAVKYGKPVLRALVLPDLYRDVLTSGVNRQKESVDIDQKKSEWNDHFQPM